MKIYVASHGRFASGLVSSVQILLGNSDKVTSFDAYVDESNLKDSVEAFLSSVSDDEQVVFMSDLYGGSVNQVLFQYLSRENTFLIAGINLAVLMELVLREQPLDDEALAHIIESSRNALQRVELSTEEDEDEDSFF